MDGESNCMVEQKMKINSHSSELFLYIVLYATNLFCICDFTVYDVFM